MCIKFLKALLINYMPCLTYLLETRPFHKCGGFCERYCAVSLGYDNDVIKKEFLNLHSHFVALEFVCHYAHHDIPVCPPTPPPKSFRFVPLTNLLNESLSACVWFMNNKLANKVLYMGIC